MARQDVAFDAYLVETLRAMHQHGLLLTTLDGDGRANTMAIGWGTPGIIWGKPIFTVFVRPSRHTYDLLEGNGDFTINVLPPSMKDVIEYCGTVSGRDADKFLEKHLTAVPARSVSAPVIDQSLITYECRTVHRNDLRPDALAVDIKDSAYAAGDYHRLYFGLILHVQAESDTAERLA